MRRFRRLVPFLIGSVLLGGCGGGGGEGSATAAETELPTTSTSAQDVVELGTLSALLGEAPFLTTSGRGEFEIDRGTLTFSGHGETDSGRAASLVFHLAEVGAPGTFPLSTGSANSAGVTLGSTPFNTIVGGAGTVTITSLSIEVVEGTFEFTASDPAGNELAVSEGTFRIPTDPL